MPVGDRQPVELLLDDKAWADEPRKLAEDVFGHQVDYDPGTNERWTCGSCGRAVIRVGANIYGSAVTVGCQFSEVGRSYNEENGDAVVSERTCEAMDQHFTIRCGERATVVGSKDGRWAYLCSADANRALEHGWSIGPTVGDVEEFLSRAGQEN